MNDLRKTIVPKSDQLNADDLIGGPVTVKVTKVSLVTGDQPVAVHIDGFEGRPFKPCKSMRRVLIHLWGDDGNAYVGRSMTLYRDPKVKWGGEEIGGIRISHMSHIDKEVTMALTATRGSRKPFTVKPLSSNGTDAPSITDEATAFAKEIDMADTAEKLELLEQRYASIAEKLTDAALPKWKDKLSALMQKQREKVDPGHILNAG